MDPMKEAAFWERVNRSGECWLWTGKTNMYGYGVIRRGRGSQGAHRYSYELVHGPITDGRHVCHKCDVRNCVRPEHLWLGSQAENIQDAAQKHRMSSGERHRSRTHPESIDRGEEHPQAKLTEDQVRAIRATTGVSKRALARRYGVADSTIRKIIDRRKWAHIP
jgi:DNA-binding transcriptional regulator YiaG